MSQPKLFIDIDHLYELDSKGKICRTLDYLYNAIDDALYDGHEEQSWPDIEEFLDKFDIERASTTLVVGVLMSTLCVKSKLEGRKDLFDRIKIKFLKEEGSYRTGRLLAGLE